MIIASIDQSDLIQYKESITKFFDLPAELKRIVFQLLISGEAILIKKKRGII